MVILPMALSGGTSSASLAGTLVSHNAEVLSTVVLAQLLKKGLPCTYGSTSTILDLRFGTSAIGSPEYGMINASLARIARYYRLPSWVGGGASDSKEPDVQSGYEFSLSATLSALSGANIIFGSGVIEQGMTMDYAKLVMDAEMICRNPTKLRRRLKAVRTAAEHRTNLKIRGRSNWRQILQSHSTNCRHSLIRQMRSDRTYLERSL